MSIFIILALVAQFGWSISRFDVFKAHMLAALLRHHTADGLCKSRSGGRTFGSGACIYAWSTIQQSIALSTFESELYALVLGIRNLLPLRRITTFIIGTVNAQLQRRDLSSRSLHIRSNLGFIYEAIDNDDIHVEYIRSEANPANTHKATENRNRFARNHAVLSERAELS